MYDQLQPMNAPLSDTCIDCGGLAQRLMSAPAKGNMGKDNGSSNYTNPEHFDHLSHDESCPYKGKCIGVEVIVGVGIPIPQSVADKLVKADKQRRAAPNN